MIFDLLTNGMIPNYPKNITMSLFKVRHWRDLGIASAEGLMELLVDSLDNVIDFTKTEFIKSARELTTEDILYLFFQQRIACIGDVFNITYTCDCGVKTTHKLSMKIIEEQKIKDKLEYTEQFGLKLKIPNFENLRAFTKVLKAYLDDDTKTDYKKKVGEKLVFDENQFDLLTYFSYIENLDFRDIKEYLDFIRDQEMPVLKYIQDFREKTFHGFKSETKVKCKSCGKEESIEIPTDPTFFLE